MKYYDIEFAYDLPNGMKTDIFKRMTLDHYRYLRSTYEKKYGKDLLSVEVYVHKSSKRVASLCWNYEENNKGENKWI